MTASRTKDGTHNSALVAVFAFIFDGDARDALGELGVDAWIEVAATVDRLDAGALLFAALKRRRAVELVPPAIAQRWRQRHAENVARAMEVTHVTTELAERFARRGIAWMPLKGVAMVRLGWHEALGTRWFSDIDILVSPNDRGEVANIVESLGFRGTDLATKKHPTPYVRHQLLIEPHLYGVWGTDGVPIDVGAAHALGLRAHTAAHLAHHLFVSSVPEPSLRLKTMQDFFEMHRAGTRSVDDDVSRALGRVGLAAPIGSLEEDLAFLSGWRGGEGADPAMTSRILERLTPWTERRLAEEERAYEVRSLTRYPMFFRRATLEMLVSLRGRRLEAFARDLRKRLTTRFLGARGPATRSSPGDKER